eukprot:5845313-Alexandrium_andersonii.AAC.1
MLAVSPCWHCGFERRVGMDETVQLAGNCFGHWVRGCARSPAPSGGWDQAAVPRPSSGRAERVLGAKGGGPRARK